jgi:hypothetical protein
MLLKVTIDGLWTQVAIVRCGSNIMAMIHDQRATHELRNPDASCAREALKNKITTHFRSLKV